MGQWDEKLNRYLSDPRRFADLFNAAKFGGQKLVDWEALEELSERNYEGGGNVDNYASTYVDIKKRLKSGAVLKILALETQTVVDYSMPLRIMESDQREYRKQAKQLRRNKRLTRKQEGKPRSNWMERFTKEDKLVPIYTICFYHGEAPWDGPRSLKDMMNFGEDEDKAGSEDENASQGASCKLSPETASCAMFGGHALP